MEPCNTSPSRPGRNRWWHPTRSPPPSTPSSVNPQLCLYRSDRGPDRHSTCSAFILFLIFVVNPFLHHPQTSRKNRRNYVITFFGLHLGDDPAQGRVSRDAARDAASVVRDAALQGGRAVGGSADGHEEAARGQHAAAAARCHLLHVDKGMTDLQGSGDIDGDAADREENTDRWTELASES